MTTRRPCRSRPSETASIRVLISKGRGMNGMAGRTGVAARPYPGELLASRAWGGPASRLGRLGKPQASRAILVPRTRWRSWN